ncbi:hypothetical protein BH23THE1_BH23THE1_11840 [soil metagenome]
MLVIMHFNKGRSIKSFDTSTYYFYTDGLEQSIVTIYIFMIIKQGNELAMHLARIEIDE